MWADVVAQRILLVAMLIFCGTSCATSRLPDSKLVASADVMFFRATSSYVSWICQPEEIAKGIQVVITPDQTELSYGLTVTRTSEGPKRVTFEGPIPHEGALQDDQRRLEAALMIALNQPEASALLTGDHSVDISTVLDGVRVQVSDERPNRPTGNYAAFVVDESGAVVRRSMGR